MIYAERSSYGATAFARMLLLPWKVPVEEKVRKDNHYPLAVDNASLASIVIL